MIDEYEFDEYQARARGTHVIGGHGDAHVSCSIVTTEQRS